MSAKQMTYISISIAVLVLTYFGWKLTARGAYESADYAVLETDGQFETREYPELSLATTNMKFETQGDDGSFMRLFRYISGGNNDGQKVAMTTPVFMEPQTSETQGQMGFVLPKTTVDQGIPLPIDADVKIQKRIGGQFAVIRFAGRTNSDTFAKAEEQLRNWMNEKGLIDAADAEFAGYDPPWTPSPLRRNEVLIRCE